MGHRQSTARSSGADAVSDQGDDGLKGRQTGGEDSNPLYRTLEDMADASRAGDCTFGDLVDRVGARGFGPLLIFCSAIVILPTGALPGVPAVVGLLVILLGVQLLTGLKTPLLPRRLRNMALSQSKLDAAVRKGKPVARFLGALVRPRAAILASGPVAQRAVGLMIVVAGVTMIPLGFVPMVPLLIGVPLLVMGMAMTARDGIAMMIAVALFFLPAYALYRYVGPDIVMHLS